MNDLYDLLSTGGISIDRLITLCRFVDAGGLTKAAGGNVSRLSLYSRQVKDLEGFFHVALTRKVGRTVVPTDAAIKLAGTARGHLKDLQEFRGAGTAGVTFVLGASHSLLEWYIAPRLELLRKALGDRRPIRLLAMRSREIAEAIGDRRLDLGLVRKNVIPRGVPSRHLLKMGFSLYVQRRLAGNRKLEELLSELPLATSMGGELAMALSDAAGKHELRLNFQIEATSFTLAAAAVRTGICAAVLPDIVPLDRDTQRIALPSKFALGRDICACWHHSANERNISLLLKALMAPRWRVAASSGMY